MPKSSCQRRNIASANRRAVVSRPDYVRVFPPVPRFFPHGWNVRHACQSARAEDGAAVLKLYKRENEKWLKHATEDREYVPKDLELIRTRLKEFGLTDGWPEAEDEVKAISEGSGDEADAGKEGNDARSSNRDCSPNLEAQKFTTLGEAVEEHQVGFFAQGDIKPGEELYHDYNFDSFASRPTKVSPQASSSSFLPTASECIATNQQGDGRQRCNCGTSVCSGWIGAKQKGSSEDKGKGKERAKEKETPSSSASVPSQPLRSPTSRSSSSSRPTTSRPSSKPRPGAVDNEQRISHTAFVPETPCLVTWRTSTDWKTATTEPPPAIAIALAQSSSSSHPASTSSKSRSRSSLGLSPPSKSASSSNLPSSSRRTSLPSSSKPLAAILPPAISFSKRKVSPLVPLNNRSASISALTSHPYAANSEDEDKDDPETSAAPSRISSRTSKRPRFSYSETKPLHPHGNLTSPARYRPQPNQNENEDEAEEEEEEEVRRSLRVRRKRASEISLLSPSPLSTRSSRAAVPTERKKKGTGFEDRNGGRMEGMHRLPRGI